MEQAVWPRVTQIDQPEAIASLVAKMGMPEQEYRDYLSAEGTRRYHAAQEEAAADHIFGVPLFIFQGEPLWGHDRLPIVEQCLNQDGLRISGS